MSESDTSDHHVNDHEANMDIDPNPDLGDNPACGNQITRLVQHLSLNYLRMKLDEHFFIQFSQNSLQWPSRTDMVEPRISAP
jgi:hypothetical protein